MKCNFYPIESKLYDFLKFPRLIYYKEDYEENKDDQNYEDLVFDDYLDFVKKVDDRLKPFIKDIEIFYLKLFRSNYDFIDLLSRVKSIFNYKSEKEYLDMLLTLNEHEIIKSIIYSMIIANEDYHSYSDEVMKRAEELCSSKNDIVSFIKDLPIEAGSKWNLFLIIEEPIKYINKYVDLMTKLLPIFEDIYSPYEDEVSKYGQYLDDFLNGNGAKGLKDITNSMLDEKLFTDEYTNIIISVIFSYAITIVSTAKDKYIAWGLKIEDAFKMMNEINENKTVERVQIFKNLGDKTRYEVLKLIASGQTSTKEIASTLGVSSATISYHLNNLVNSRVTKIDKSSNKFGYVVDYDLLEETIQDFKNDLDFPVNNS